MIDSLDIKNQNNYLFPTISGARSRISRSSFKDVAQSQTHIPAYDQFLSPREKIKPQKLKPQKVSIKKLAQNAIVRNY